MQFVVFENFSSASLQEIAREIMLLLKNNIHEKGISQRQGKRNLSYKSFKKLKFMNLLSVLHVERAYKLKKKFSVFFSQFVAKKEVISTLLTWISSVLRKAAIVPLNLQIRVLQISTARIDG